MSKFINRKERLDAIGEEIFGNKTEDSAEMKRKQTAYNRAFWDSMQTGYVSNALKEGSDGSGGYFVPDEFDKRIIKALEEENILRKLGKVIKTESTHKIPRMVDGYEAEWYDENDRFDFSGAEFDEIVFNAYKLGTLLKVSSEFLEDTPQDIENFIYEMIVERFSRSEEEAFFTGDGIGKPLGIIHQAQVGTVTENKGDINLDDIIELVYSVKKPYRENAVFIMSEEAYACLKKFKNYNGRNIWKVANGEPDTLFGYPVYTTTKLDGIESGNKPVLFGNFDFYCIAERGNRIIRRLSERYAEHGQVGFIGTQRVDAKLVIPEAIKSLEIK